MARPDLPLTEPLKIVGELADTLIRSNTRYKENLSLERNIVDVQIETQTQGANALTISISDPSLRLFTTGFFEMQEEPDGLWRLPPVEVELDGVTWRLVDVQGTSELSSPNVVLEFEPKAIAMLRRHFGPVSATRGKGQTRAEFLRRLASVVKDELEFYCPALTEAQPIAPETEAQGEKKERKAASKTGKSKGFGSNTGGLGLSAAQVKVAEEVLKTCERCSSGERPAIAALCACIAESHFDPEARDPSEGAEGLYQWNPTSGTLQAEVRAGMKLHDVPSETEHFLNYLGGGAIKVAHENPQYSAAEVAYHTEKPATDKELKAAEPQAAKIYSAWGGVGTTGSTEKQVPYKFAVTNEEDYFAGMIRLAQEVQWPLWMEGNILHYMKAEEIIQTEPILSVDVVNKTIKTRHEVKEGKRTKTEYLKTSKNAIAQFTFGFSETEEKARGELTEVTKRKVKEVRANKKNRNPGAALTTECTIQVICKPGLVYAGDVIVLEDPSGKGPWQTNGYGGRWAVVNATRSIFNAYTELQLAIPGSSTLPKPLGEQKNETETGSSSITGQTVSGSKVPSAKAEVASAGAIEPKDSWEAVAAYSNCQYIEAQQLPYVWGGGHQKIGGVNANGFTNEFKSSAFGPEPVEQGYDCSGAVSAALGAGNASMMPGGVPKTTTGFADWGSPGKGDWMTLWVKSNPGESAEEEHVLLEFTISKNTKWFEAGPRGSGGGKFWTTPEPSNLEAAGFKPRHWPGT